MEKLFREKAYKILYEEYSKLYERILTRARNVKEYGKEDGLKHKEFVDTVVDVGKYSHCGLQDRESVAIIDMLRYLLDDTQPVK